MPAALTVNLSLQDKAKLESFANNATHSKKRKKRAEAILLLNAGKNASEVATALKASPNSVTRWYRDFCAGGIKGLLYGSAAIDNPDLYTEYGLKSQKNKGSRSEDKSALADHETEPDQGNTDKSNVINRLAPNLMAWASSINSPFAVFMFLLPLFNFVGQNANDDLLGIIIPKINTVLKKMQNLTDFSDFQNMYEDICSIINCIKNSKKQNKVDDVHDNSLIDINQKLKSETTLNLNLENNNKSNENEINKMINLMQNISNFFGVNECNINNVNSNNENILFSENSYNVEFKFTKNNSLNNNVTAFNINLKEGELNFNSKEQFANSISTLLGKINGTFRKFEKSVIDNYSKDEALNDVFGNSKEIKTKELNSFDGKFKINLPKRLYKKYVNTEYVWDPYLLNEIMNCISIMSYRKGIDSINSMLRLEEDEKIHYRNMQYKCCKEGKNIDKCVDELLNILEEYGIDKKTGEIVDKTKLPEEVINSTTNSEYDKRLDRVVICAAESYNETKDKKELKIKRETYLTEKVYTINDTVSISVDEVLVKRQESTRNDSDDEIDSKKSKKLSTFVATLTASNGVYDVAANTRTRALLIILAIMLKENLLFNKKLVFFTDGDESLNDEVKKIFGFREFEIKLDFYHLKKKCSEYLSMAIKGGKENLERNRKLRQEVFSRLFVKNIDEAINFIDNIDKSIIARKNYIEKVKTYISKKSPYMYCYAIYKEMHLKNSSSDVENANFRLVTSRCKNNGTSWVNIGLNGMRNIKSVFSNNEKDWFTSRILSFKLKPLSDKLLEKKDWLDGNFDEAA